MVQARPYFNMGGKVEYPWLEASALHLVESEGCSLLWAAQTDRNHHRRSLSITIDAFEPSIKEQWQSDFAIWQHEATFLWRCKKIGQLVFSLKRHVVFWREIQMLVKSKACNGQYFQGHISNKFLKIKH